MEKQGKIQLYGFKSPTGEPIVLVGGSEGRVLYSARERDGQVIMTKSVPGSNLRQDFGPVKDFEQAERILLARARTHAANKQADFEDHTGLVDSLRDFEYGDPNDRRMQV